MDVRAACRAWERWLIPRPLDGDAEWSGDFLLEPETPVHPAQLAGAS